MWVIGDFQQTFEGVDRGRLNKALVKQSIPSKLVTLTILKNIKAAVLVGTRKGIS